MSIYHNNFNKLRIILKIGMEIPIFASKTLKKLTTNWLGVLTVFHNISLLWRAALLIWQSFPSQVVNLLWNFFMTNQANIFQRHFRKFRAYKTWCLLGNRGSLPLVRLALWRTKFAFLTSAWSIMMRLKTKRF